ncbi:peptidase S8/S53 domain-containing protein, partial [Mycena olivaceomarginata]
GNSRALDEGINALTDVRIHIAVAAENDNRDACDYSPSGAAGALTVSTSTIGDARADFSNYGECVDVFAPDLDILSTFIESNTATPSLSGTSMASP